MTRLRNQPSEACLHYLATTPTDSTLANPGSEEKIAVMSARVDRGESCFAAGEPRCEVSRSRSFHFQRTPKSHKE